MKKWVAPLLLFHAWAYGATPQPKELVLTPESLREALLGGSLTITQALNQVHDAKDQLSISRAKLIPSVNVSGLFAPTKGPTFIFSAIEFLLPFLMPANWINMYASRQLFDAQKISYEVLELNTYCSALSIYYTAVADHEISQVYAEQASDIARVYEIKAEQFDLDGIGSAANVAHAQAEMQLAQIQASQLAEMSKNEIATLRKALGLPLSTVLTLQNVPMNPSDVEKGNAQQAVDEAYHRAPEREQIDHLVEAAKLGVWSQVFGAVNGTSVGSQAVVTDGSLHSFSLSNLAVKGTVSLGVGMIPAFELSSRNVDEIELRLKELYQETTRVVEAAFNSLTEATRQAELASSAEANLELVYNSKMEAYDFGQGSLLAALLARNDLSSAKIYRIKAELDLNLLRATLHRALLTDQFSRIEGCQKSEPKEKETGLFAWLKGIFAGGDEDHSTLDDVCRPKPKNA